MTLSKATQRVITDLQCKRGSEALVELRRLRWSRDRKLTSDEVAALRELEAANKIAKRK